MPTHVLVHHNRNDNIIELVVNHNICQLKISIKVNMKINF